MLAFAELLKQMPFKPAQVRLAWAGDLRRESAARKSEIVARQRLGGDLEISGVTLHFAMEGMLLRALPLHGDAHDAGCQREQ
jgi:hypothetical protein